MIVIKKAKGTEPDTVRPYAALRSETCICHPE